MKNGSTSESESSDGDSSNSIEFNSSLSSKRKVTFGESSRPPLGRDKNLLARLATRRLKNKLQPMHRPASVVPISNNLNEDDELSSGMRNLTLRSKSVSPALFRRSNTPLQIKRSQTPTVLIPSSGQHGMGKIYLQMPDIIRPGLTRTLSLSYSTSSLNHNSRLMTEKVDTKVYRKERAQTLLVRRIETRLETLKRKREAFIKAREEEQRKNNEEEEAVKRTDKLLDKKKSENFMTVAEREQMRKERIHLRTSLMHYRTANYLRNFDANYIKKLKSQVRYSRTVDLKSTNLTK